jgi:hypothetical protein
MINIECIELAKSLFDPNLHKGVSISVNNLKVDINSTIIKDPTTKPIKLPVFIEFEEIQEGIHIWLWTPKHPQYEWIKNATGGYYNEGVFQVVRTADEDHLFYKGSIYETVDN